MVVEKKDCCEKGCCENLNEIVEKKELVGEIINESNKKGNESNGASGTKKG